MNKGLIIRTPTITIACDGTTADALSRPDALKESGTTLCSYRYLGSGVVVGVKYDAASNIELTYEDGGTGDAGDPYTGLDRFGRLVETLWKKGGTDQVRSKYGRNRFGGVTWRRDVNAHAQSPAVDTEDNYYWYDALYQVAERQRGDLAGTAPDYTGISNLRQDEAWTYDASGNWQASSNTAPTSAQARINNTANEITLLSSAAGDITPAYDPAGNMTTLPKAPGTATAQYDLKWDAWNRLVEVKDGSTVVASYTYDGLTRRLTKTNDTETRHYYYDDQWRPVEERVNGNKERQYTWGLRDRWDLLRRTLHSGTWATHYVLRDYLDPVAIVGTDGEIKERYTYDAFGNVRFLAPDYSARSASDFAWDFLFHAEFRDPETKLYNYGYRYYDAGLGRWLSRDPIGEEGGVNLYGFVGNFTTGWLDQFGLQEIIPGLNGSSDPSFDIYRPSLSDFRTLRPGPFALDRIAASGPTSTGRQRRIIRGFYVDMGCHHCGDRTGVSIADHMEPTNMVGRKSGQFLYPQCDSCRGVQAEEVKYFNRFHSIPSSTNKVKVGACALMVVPLIVDTYQQFQAIAQGQSESMMYNQAYRECARQMGQQYPDLTKVKPKCGCCMLHVNRRYEFSSGYWWWGLGSAHGPHGNYSITSVRGVFHDKPCNEVTTESYAFQEPSYDAVIQSGTAYPQMIHNLRE